MSEVDQLCDELVRRTLRGEPLPAWPAATWQAILAPLQAGRVGPLLYTHWRARAGWHDLPQPVRDAWTEDFRWHSVRALLLERELAAIVDDLAADGVPVLLLKGAALSRLVYGSPAERPTGDLDLLIHAPHLAVARRRLDWRGYVAQGLYLLPALQQQFRAELPLVCRAADRAGLLVELHWSLLELPYYMAQIKPADLWQATQPAPGLPNGNVPNSATLLLHACAHWGFHHSDDQPLIWLVDIDRLVTQGALDWETVLARAGDWHLTLALQRVLTLATARLGTPVPAHIAAALDRRAPAAAERLLWGAATEQTGRAGRRALLSLYTLRGGRRWRYLGWAAVRALLTLPEAWIRRRLGRSRG